MQTFIRFLTITLLMTTCFSLSVKRDLRCGSDTPLITNGGEIISHAGYEFGHHYGKDLNCSWTIMAPAGQYVELVAENFTVDGGTYSSCSYYNDYVELFDGPSVSSKSLGKFCGSTFNPISSTGNYLTVEFKTNGYNQYQGFRFYYNFTDHVIHSCRGYQFMCDNGFCLSRSYKCDNDDDCGDDSDEMNCPVPTCTSSQFTCANHKCEPLGWLCDGDNDCGDGSDELTSNCQMYTTTTIYRPSCGQLSYTGTSGTIHSPNYPYHYYNSMYCQYHINAPTWTNNLSFSFNKNFSIEANSICSFDYVKIYSQGSTYYTHGPYCGSTAPSDFAIATNSAIVLFSTDGSGWRTGFQLTWIAT